VSLLYSWELNDKWSLAGSVLGNKAIDDDRHAFLMMASSLSLGYSFTDKLGSYFEYFGFYPSGAVAPGVKPEYYLNGGFTYKVTKNFQLDVRAGFGLNEAADDFFTGAGFAVRY
jgi:Putative MetA-pathway of phenol degradation